MLKCRQTAHRTGVLLLPVLVAVIAAASAQAADGWTNAPYSRVRLNWCGTAEGLEAKFAKNAVELAFLELRLDPGWKTYWRSPGDAGVPPNATWEKSQNLARASFYFPAPRRLPDQGGDSIGYKDRVVLPVRVERTNSKAPVALAMSLSFGVCKNICVPVEVELNGACFTDSRNDIATNVEAVPREPGQRLDSDPNLIAVTGSVTAAVPRLAIDVDFGAGATDTDLFIEAPEGLYVPLPARAAPDAKGRARFTVDLSKVLDAKDLAGKTLRLTMVSSKGASEAEWVAK
jgi:DsbC/DsbD-like thiol-disulfide interchange protein